MAGAWLTNTVYPQHRQSSRTVGAFVDYLLDALPPKPAASSGNSA